MTDDRAGEPAFALQDICFIDFESRSQTNIKAGTWRYAVDADAIVMVYAIGDGPVQTASVQDFSSPLWWTNVPADLRIHFFTPGKVFAAWNAGFDRAIWNFATLGFPELRPSDIIDVMAQATASGLPPDLNYSAKFTGGAHKVAAGKSLIALFCVPDSSGAPQSHPAEWAAFLAYAAGDIEAMRDVYKRTRPLPLREWQEYWAMEAINDRGVRIDLAMVEHAANLAGEDSLRSAEELAKLTDGAVRTVNQVQAMTEWLLARLPPAGRDILLKAEPEIDENGSETVPAKYALTRKQVERLIALNTDPVIDRVLQIRLYGGSKTPAKFKRMVEGHVDGVLYGQYVFNGAAQTGRASSKGVQIHNLARDTLAYEHEAIESLLSSDNYRQFATIGDSSPVARKLSLLIRPAFVPADGNVFVWSDWAQIEARVLPWLCGDDSQGARDRLNIFREVDADPSKPDLYTRTAAVLSNVETYEVTKAMRQRGKVAELALGFCGGKNSLQTMAAGYGMHLDDEEAQRIVQDWRKENEWAGDFARDLWNAMEIARETPDELVPVGRVGFCYLAWYLGGSLVCRLPSGRLLTYRALRNEMVDKKDANGKVIGREMELTYARGHNRAKLWPGIFVENVTQAVAADILRGTLVKLENDQCNVRVHTHDEVLIETPEQDAEIAAIELSVLMRQGFDWSVGLPLMSEETIAPYYSKRA